MFTSFPALNSHPISLSDFQFREPDDSSDLKLLEDVQRHGWHVVAIPADHHGPGFAFTVGLYLRTLQPEILIMGVDIAPSGRVLNAIGDYLMAGGELIPEQRYPEFVNGRKLFFVQLTLDTIAIISAARFGFIGITREAFRLFNAFGRTRPASSHMRPDSTNGSEPCKRTYLFRRS